MVRLLAIDIRDEFFGRDREEQTQMFAQRKLQATVAQQKFAQLRRHEEADVQE
jgi:hypothetical protein